MAEASCEKPKTHPKPARRARAELAEVVRLHGPAYRLAHRPPAAHLKILSAIERCRTEALGGHIDKCDSCGHERPSYNSCRNRHCPKCQAAKSAQWVAERENEILPVGYFHLVFTLPHELNALILTNKRELFGLLFSAVSETLLEFGRKNLGGQLGFTSVLHTWDRTLGDHFHIHALVAGGVLTKAGWKQAPKSFLFPVNALSKVFRAKFLSGLSALRTNLRWVGKSELLAEAGAYSFFENVLKSKKWIVYAKAPFQRPETVLQYLGRYTHRVALSNSRLTLVDKERVSFVYRQRRSGHVLKSMSLSGEEFLRRFLLHELPKDFKRIRHYGFHANRAKKEALAKCREALGEREPRPLASEEPLNRHQCRQCDEGTLFVTRILKHDRFERKPAWNTS